MSSTTKKATRNHFDQKHFDQSLYQWTKWDIFDQTNTIPENCLLSCLLSTRSLLVVRWRILWLKCTLLSMVSLSFLVIFHCSLASCYQLDSSHAHLSIMAFFFILIFFLCLVWSRHCCPRLSNPACCDSHLLPMLVMKQPLLPNSLQSCLFRFSPSSHVWYEADFADQDSPILLGDCYFN